MMKVGRKSKRSHFIALYRKLKIKCTFFTYTWRRLFLHETTNYFTLYANYADTAAINLFKPVQIWLWSIQVLWQQNRKYFCRMRNWFIASSPRCTSFNGHWNETIFYSDRKWNFYYYAIRPWLCCCCCTTLSCNLSPPLLHKFP